mmetsp:Transcript_15847/g.19069  ORF Transcript_15847/g.19069 Transcript_15847/m.19069 type:complete len:319 (+) Transcript_15847:330-1286(+)|eukprot:CAMPEP_0197846408 /NCGR_PEP_ID=MMETSP1438-20131217/3154_1 /TAXON_ID=1461541 /ORGANISM="Pterosperma sp., Strain CCMP1384" /LENGTH=318 /DNA_ID=CAMNT_0043458049 /DNA_START=330 /DNA_END=1286 /DNA_ORIENTATION=+
MFDQTSWQGQPQTSMQTPQHPSADPQYAAASFEPVQGGGYGYGRPADINVEGGPATGSDANMMQGMMDSMISNPSMVKSFAKAGLGAYGEKSYNFVQNTANKYFSGETLHRYFNLDQQYVVNKLKLLACPVLHKGSWARIPEQVAGGMTYKPPRHDINAPDLYIPIMGLLSYTLLGSGVMLVDDKFTPETLRSYISYGLMAWVFSAMVLWAGLKSIATAQVPINVPFLDLLSYSGYAFVPVCWSMVFGCGLGKYGKYGYYFTWLWGSSCMAVFIVKTMKRIIFAEARHYGVDSKSNNYHLLAIALIQYPVAYWLAVLP